MTNDKWNHSGQSLPRRQSITFYGDRSSQARPLAMKQLGHQASIGTHCKLQWRSNLALGQFASSLTLG